MSIPVVATGFIISIVILLMILVKDVNGTQDDDTITLTILFNYIVKSPTEGTLLGQGVYR